RLLVSLDGANAVTARYVHGVGLIGREAADGSYVGYAFDARGNTLALVDANGAITDAYAYSPFGRVLASIGATDHPVRTGGSFGLLSDGNGLVCSRARTYAPALQRFLQRDYLFGDLRVPQTLNSYAFVTGNPLQYIDPLGLGNKDSGGGDDKGGGDHGDS